MGWWKSSGQACPLARSNSCPLARSQVKSLEETLKSEKGPSCFFGATRNSPSVLRDEKMAGSAFRKLPAFFCPPSFLHLGEFDHKIVKWQVGLGGIRSPVMSCVVFRTVQNEVSDGENTQRIVKTSEIMQRFPLRIIRLAKIVVQSGNH